MPFPMAHLYVARHLATAWPRLNEPSFYLGTLAPDAYVMRAQRDPGDRALAHLEDADPEQWRKNILRFIKDPARPCGGQFGLGYAAHLLTDWSWGTKVLPRYGDEQGRMSGEQRNAYVRDMVALDLTLYREEAGFRAELWPLIRGADSQGLVGYVSAEEVDLERERTLSWYAPRATLAEPSARLADWMPDLTQACRFTLEGLSARMRKA